MRVRRRLWAWPAMFCVCLLSGCGASEVDHYDQGVEAYEAAETDEDLERAITLFDKALEQDDEDVEALVARGLAYDTLGRYDEAVADYEKALEIEPDNTDALLNLGAVWHEQADYRRAVDTFTQVLLLDDDDPEAYRNRALAYVQLNQFEAAAVDLTWALILTPYVDPVLYRERADVWKQLNNQAQYDLDIAVADATQEIADNEDNATAYATRGQSLLLLGEYSLAVADFSEAIRVDADKSAYFSARGSAQSMLGQVEQAVEDYDTAIRLDEKNVAAYVGRGDARKNQGEYARATADYRQAIQLDPKLASPQAGLAWILATCPDAKLRNGEEARRLAQQACELSEWAIWSFVDVYAAACAEAGDFDEAQKQETRAIVMAADLVDTRELKDRLKLYEQKKPYHRP